MEVMSIRDDVTVRIDTELRAKARELEINMSRLLEDELRTEIARREAVAETREGSEEIRLELEDSEGRRYVGKFTGKFLGEGHGVEAYLADDERLIIYDTDKREFWENPDDLASWFPNDPGVYAEIMHALGEPPEIEI
jgi:post-segregation antitoxin (ccd killing protein)